MWLELISHGLIDLLCLHPTSYFVPLTPTLRGSRQCGRKILYPVWQVAPAVHLTDPIHLLLLAFAPAFDRLLRGKVVAVKGEQGRWLVWQSSARSHGCSHWCELSLIKVMGDDDTTLTLTLGSGDGTYGPRIAAAELELDALWMGGCGVCRSSVPKECSSTIQKWLAGQKWNRRFA